MTTDTLSGASKRSVSAGLRREVFTSSDGRRWSFYELSRVDAASLANLQGALEAQQPGAVAVELDSQRFEWLQDKESWEALNLLDILREKKGRLLGSYLAMRTLQKRFGSFDGAEPGDEMRLATRFAGEHDKEVLLLDRDMKTTGLRAWRRTPFFQRNRLFLAMMAGPFRRTRTREDAESAQGRLARLARLRARMPRAAEAFLEERQTYMAARLYSSQEKDVAVVLSPLHYEGVMQSLRLMEEAKGFSEEELSHLEVVPKRGLVSKVIPWAFTAVIVGIFVSLFFSGDSQQVHDALLMWLIINGSLTALFTSIALPHPLTVLFASLSAPFVSLNPAIGAGTVGVFVQAFLRPPTIVDIEKVGDDIVELKGWWRNEVARLVLIFILANGGSTVGTFIALAKFPSIFE